MQPTPVFWPGEFHGQRKLVGYNQWGSKESDTTEQLTCINLTERVSQKHVFTNLQSLGNQK